MTRSWYRALARKSLSGQPLPSPSRTGPRPRVRLRLEPVEDRTVTSAVSLEPPTPMAAALADLFDQPTATPSDELPLAPDGGADVPDLELPTVEWGVLDPGSLAMAGPGVGGHLFTLGDGFNLPATDSVPLRMADAGGQATLEADGIEEVRRTRSRTGDRSEGTNTGPAADPDAVRPPGPGPKSRPAAAPASSGIQGTPAGPTPSAVVNGPALQHLAPILKAAGAKPGPIDSGPALVGPIGVGRPARPADAPVTQTSSLPADLSDGALLQRFAVGGEQAAFTALVQRHGSFVLAVCQRVLGDWHAAQDAAQATFMVLARKAGLLDRNGPLGGWLSKVAYHLALRSRAVAARHRQGEWEAGNDAASFAETEFPAADLERQEVSQAVREELQRLPEKYRTPLILCYFDGRTHDDAAREIGMPRGSMAKRIGEGLERLREGLLARGFMV